jgi:hypothetical protein
LRTAAHAFNMPPRDGVSDDVDRVAPAADRMSEAFRGTLAEGLAGRSANSATSWRGAATSWRGSMRASSPFPEAAV